MGIKDKKQELKDQYIKDIKAILDNQNGDKQQLFVDRTAKYMQDLSKQSSKSFLNEIRGQLGMKKLETKAGFKEAWKENPTFAVSKAVGELLKPVKVVKEVVQEKKPSQPQIMKM